MDDNGGFFHLKELMDKKSRTTYRHGNIREEAVKFSLEITDTEGHEALSMRKVAGHLGVAHRALYNHFKDREALLDAVATEGFNQLADEVDNSATQNDFIATYLDFALKRSSLYNLMMSRPHATMSDTPPLQSAVHRVITKAMSFFGSPNNSSEENRRAVMKATILLHGGITLRTNGILDVPDDKGFIEEISRMMEVG
ncbi:TetR family transcriptional regulator [Sneathiella sp. P13V-1]|uniref:TetR/AcrR family transcriptional regulator n=1 Tax=Sneathiella sp. P13V-1 TaxID=2697366 RepID=UPI00187B88C2|nr:TetR/AcrR family transcriptional regulator [Sneathiella sp. P13V-1]MBE7635237.1 TetR family transcriptional regulator [Sneathiella sp. P13V-1]